MSNFVCPGCTGGDPDHASDPVVVIQDGTGYCLGHTPPIKATVTVYPTWTDADHAWTGPSDSRRTVRVDARSVVIEARTVREFDGSVILTAVRLDLRILPDADLVNMVQRETRPEDFR